MRPRVLALLASLTLVLAACGDATTTPDSSDEPGTWETQLLEAEVGSDQAPLLAVSGDDVLVLTVSDDGAMTSHLSRDGAPFEAGQPLSTGSEYPQLGGVVAAPDGGWLAMGSDDGAGHVVLAFRSEDGLAWEPAAVTGFADAVDLSDLVVVDGTVIAAGSYRTADNPSEGGFEAHVWASGDGAAFTEVDLPGVRAPRGYRNESYVADLALVGDRLLAVGAARGAAVWASDDAAETWSRVSDPALEDIYSASSVAVSGETMVLGVAEERIAALRSTDGGDTWEPVTGLPKPGEEGGWAPVWSDGARFWTLTGVDDMGWSRPEVCYADLDQCGQNPPPRFVASADTAKWTAVELPGEADEIAGTADGRTLALSVERGGVAVHTLPAGTTPPEAPPLPDPETVELVTLAEGERPEVGVRYHAPMYVHCGMRWFWFGDATWRRTDRGAGVETGAGDATPEGWPIVGETIYGYATLTDAEHLEYSIGDDVIATYRRADGAPGCY